MQRRQFVKNTSLFAFGIGVFGNIRWDNGHYKGMNPTTTDILGPFYRPGAPMRTNVIPPNVSGQTLHLSGTVFRDDGKTPYRNGLIEIWQCSPEGIYDNVSDEYLFRGAQKITSNGQYHFVTCLPVPYATDEAKKNYRPAHIHMRVSGEGEQDLVTQIYFKGDPYIPQDSSSKSPQAIHRILDVKTNNQNQHEVVFDIVMAKEIKLEDGAFSKIVGLYNINNNINVEFYKNGNLLFAKTNGQILNALYYKGNNQFMTTGEDAKVQFEFKENGDVTAKIDLRNDATNEWVKMEARKMLKYKL